MADRDNMPDFDDDYTPEPDNGNGLRAYFRNKKNILVVIIAIIAVATIVKLVFFKEKKPRESSTQFEISPEVPEVEAPLPTIPTLPEPPKIEPPKPPAEIVPPEPPAAPPPPPKEAVTALPPLPQKPPVFEAPQAPVGLPFAKRPGKPKEERLRSGIVVVGGGQAAKGEDKHIISSYYTPSKTNAAQVQATRVGEMNATIAQGKIIDAVLETAINTDIAGTVRAIVSRDIYSEAGRFILIPKGSRLIGQYTSGVIRGQKRVTVIWNRVIRTDGIDIMVDSAGIDKIGRAGVEGFLDNKYFEVIANAVLASTFSVMWAYTSDKVFKGQSTSETTTIDKEGTSSTTKVGKGTDFALKNTSDKLGQAIDQVTKDNLAVNPTITVDQGTKLKVLVQRDLVFPVGILHNSRLLQ